MKDGKRVEEILKNSKAFGISVSVFKRRKKSIEISKMVVGSKNRVLGSSKFFRL